VGAAAEGGASGLVSEFREHPTNQPTNQPTNPTHLTHPFNDVGGLSGFGFGLGRLLMFLPASGTVPGRLGTDISIGTFAGYARLNSSLRDGPRACAVAPILPSQSQGRVIGATRRGMRISGMHWSRRRPEDQLGKHPRAAALVLTRR
jgi:hypothetical protein